MNGRTRRELLAGLGAAATAAAAGCSVLDRGGDSEDTPQFDSTDIEAILDTPAPDLRRPAPVQPDAESIEAGLTRCVELVDSVPPSISSEAVPNGVVRQEIERTREDAVEAREAVESEPDRLRALESLRTARSYAREASVGFEAVRDDLTADVLAERRETRTALGTRLAQVAYAGEERGRTLLVAFRVEEFLTDARRRLIGGFPRLEPNVLELAEIAGAVEYASATDDTVAALSTRHSTIVDDPVDFTAPAEAAVESSMVSLARAGVPDSNTPIAELLGEDPDRRDLQFLAGNSISAVGRWQETLSTERSEGRFASGIEAAIRFERDARALDTVVGRINDGEIPKPETAEPIRNEREAALNAAEEVSTIASEPSLAGDVSARLLRELRRIDRNLDRYRERSADTELTREYASYIHLRARLEALPEAIGTVRERLDVRSP